ncbi:hypothetical protein MCOR25_004442 [Pyricularia grisea]|nr:hypothetical protein MCOR25_004442 [Pyricularia grisea]
MHVKYLVTLLGLQQLVSAMPVQEAQEAQDGAAAPEVQAQDLGRRKGKDGGKDGKEMITSALNQVMTVLKNLDTAINNINPKDLTTAQPLLTVAQSSMGVFQEAGAKIQAAPKLRLIDSLSIAQAGQGLGDQVKQTIGDIVKKKPVFDQLGASSLIKDQLVSQKSQTGGLQDALVSKLPAIAKPIAERQGQDIVKVVDDAIATYSQPANNSTQPPASTPPKAPASPAPPAAPKNTPAPNPAPKPPSPAPPPAAPAPAPNMPKTPSPGNSTIPKTPSNGNTTVPRPPKTGN